MTDRPPRSFRRPLYALLPLLLVAAAGWALWPRPYAVDTAPIATGTVTVTFREEGRTRLRERYVVAAPIDGMLERIEAEPGDEVTAGTPLAVVRAATAPLLDPGRDAAAQARLRAADDAVDAADAAVAAADAERSTAAAELARAEALAARGAFAIEQLDARRMRARAAAAALRTAQAQARMANTERDAARAALTLAGHAADAQSQIVVAAPVDGRIVRRMRESAGPVQAGQPLFELGNVTELEVIAEVLTEDAARLPPTARVQLLHWGGDTPLNGRVRTVEPGGYTKVSALGVEEQRVLVVIELLDPPHARTALGDGYRVDVEFNVAQLDAVTTIPTAALLRDGDAWAVYAIEEGRARLHRVRIGALGEDVAELVEGPERGTVVVLYPGDTLREGMLVVGRR